MVVLDGANSNTVIETPLTGGAGNIFEGLQQVDSLISRQYEKSAPALVVLSTCHDIVKPETHILLAALKNQGAQTWLARINTADGSSEEQGSGGSDGQGGGEACGALDSSLFRVYSFEENELRVAGSTLAWDVQDTMYLDCPVTTQPPPMCRGL